MNKVPIVCSRISKAKQVGTCSTDVWIYQVQYHTPHGIRKSANCSNAVHWR